MSEELKPCPFCGKKAIIKATTKTDVGFTIWCECSSCNAKTMGYCAYMKNENNTIDNIEQSKQHAISAWNRRANDGKIA